MGSNSSKSKIFFIVGAIILVAIVGFGAWYFLSDDKKSSDSGSSTTPSATSQTTTATPATTPATTTAATPTATPQVIPILKSSINKKDLDLYTVPKPFFLALGYLIAKDPYLTQMNLTLDSNIFSQIFSLYNIPINRSANQHGLDKFYQMFAEEFYRSHGQGYATLGADLSTIEGSYTAIVSLIIESLGFKNYMELTPVNPQWSQLPFNTQEKFKKSLLSDDLLGIIKVDSFVYDQQTDIASINNTIENFINTSPQTFAVFPNQKSKYVQFNSPKIPMQISCCQSHLTLHGYITEHSPNNYTTTVLNYNSSTTSQYTNGTVTQGPHFNNIQLANAVALVYSQY